MKALSSTTKTEGLESELGWLTAHRANRDPSAGDVEPDRSSRAPSDCLPNDGDACGAEPQPAGDHVSLTHVDGSGGEEIAKHAGTSDQPRGDVGPIGATLPHDAHGVWDRAISRAAGVVTVAGQGFRREENMDEAPHAAHGIMEDDRHAAPESEGDQRSVSAGDGELPHPHERPAVRGGHGRR